MADITDDLRKLRELLGKATPRPWSHGIIHPQSNVRRRTPDGGWGCGPFCKTADQAHHDAALIAAAVNALPGLLDEVKRLQRENDRLRSAVGRLWDAPETELATAMQEQPK